MRPILMLEINEIPWRVMDLYLSKKGYPNLKKFFSGSSTYTSITVDDGELSPWVTWPSLHRGLSNKEHGILNLGQDPSTFKGRPIWDDFLDNNLSIGICGSLQSWPPKDPGPGGFYLPDTFAHDAKCYPKYLEPLQNYNLGQVKRNGRVINKKSLVNKDLYHLVSSLPKSGVRIQTFAKIAKQLIQEKVDKNVIARRPVFQSILFWDVFKNLYNPENPPVFSTFFTNHVAGIMHRYWHHSFPEDFGSKFEGQAKPHKETLDFAMTVLDGIISDVLKMQQKNPELIVVFATSMGQEAIDRTYHEGYSASIPNLDLLFSSIGLSKNDYKPLLAMVPQVAAEITDSTKRSIVKNCLEESYAKNGTPLFVIKEIGQSLSVTIKTPKLVEIQKDQVFIKRVDDTIIQSSFSSAGIAMNKMEAGTAYHIPEGIIAINDKRQIPNDKRERIMADKVKELLLRLSGIKSNSKKSQSQVESAAV